MNLGVKGLTRFNVFKQLALGKAWSSFFLLYVISGQQYCLCSDSPATGGHSGNDGEASVGQDSCRRQGFRCFASTPGGHVDLRLAAFQRRHPCISMDLRHFEFLPRTCDIRFQLRPGQTGQCCIDTAEIRIWRHSAVGQRSSPWPCKLGQSRDKISCQVQAPFPCAQLVLRQMHWTWLSGSMDAKYWFSWLSLDV